MKTSHEPLQDAKISTPIGNLKIVYCPEGIHEIGTWENASDKAVFKPNPKQPVELLSMCENHAVGNCVRWLKDYFSNPRELGSLKHLRICPLNNPETFRARVWQSLMTVPVGSTISYGELAASAGHPKAARAVGSAMASNPVPIIVPCHRVIRSNGDIGNYGQGHEMKQWLLNHEGASVVGQ